MIKGVGFNTKCQTAHYRFLGSKMRHGPHGYDLCNVWEMEAPNKYEPEREPEAAKKGANVELKGKRRRFTQLIGLNYLPKQDPARYICCGHCGEEN